MANRYKILLDGKSGRLKPRTRTATTGGTHTIDAAAEDVLIITAQDEAFTIANPTNMDIGEVVALILTNDATARGITLGGEIKQIEDGAIPDETTSSKTHEFILTKVKSDAFLISLVVEA